MISCGQCCTPNPASARFCMGCGTGLTQLPAGPTGLRFVTVAFCDITGSTQLALRFDPQVWSAILAEYFAEVGGALVAAGGRLEKFIGDAVVGVFGADTAGEDDAIHAVQGALTALDRLSIRNEETFARFGLRLSIRFGIASGRVAMADRDSSFAIGSVMNRAARLQAAAPVDGTAVDVRTWLLVRDQVACTAVEPVAAKGFAAPLQAWSVSAGEPPVPPEAIFVNQTEVLSQLRGAVDTAAGTPGPTTIGLVGDMGSGKTRILHRLLAQYEAQRVRTLFIASHGPDEGLWRLQQIERDLGGRPAGRAGTPSTAELQWRIRRRFADLSRVGPVLVAIDDYPRSVETLRGLLDLPADTPGPVIFLLAGRETPTPTAITVEIPPLSTEHAYELLIRLRGGIDLHTMTGTVPLIRRGRGNPLFLEQLAALAADGIDDDVAPSAEAALGSRIDRLPGPTRQVLGYLGAWDGEPRPGDLDAVSELDEASVSAGLAELEELGLAANRTAAEVAYAHLGLAERARVHAAIARRLQEYAGTEPALLETAVGHATRAHRCWRELNPGSADERAAALLAAHCLIGAARQAVGRSEVGRAAELAGQARQLAVSDDGLCLEIAALESYGLGASGHVVEALDRIAAVAGLGGNPSARAHLSVNEMAFGVGDLATARALADVADDPCATARLRTWEGLRAAQVGDYPRAEALLRQAYEGMGRFGAGLGVAEIYGNLALFLGYGDTPVPDAIAACLALRDEVASAPILHAVVSCPAAVLLQRGGDPAAAGTLLAEALAVFTGIGHVVGQAGAYEFGSVVAELAGDLAGAREAIERARRVYAEAGARADAARCGLRAYVVDPSGPVPDRFAVEDTDDWEVRVLRHQVAALAGTDRAEALAELDRALAEIAGVRGSGAVLIPLSGCLRVARRLADPARTASIRAFLDRIGHRQPAAASSTA